MTTQIDADFQGSNFPAPSRKRTRVQKITGNARIVEYGIFDAQSNQEVLDYDTFVSAKIENKVKISDFPVEDGAFASYNKVNNPFQLTVRVAVSGAQDRRHALIINLDSLLKSVLLMNIVTPDCTILNGTLSGYAMAFDKTVGRGQIIADLTFTEIREVSPQYTNAVPPGGRGAKGGGVVKPIDNPLFTGVDEAGVTSGYAAQTSKEVKTGTQAVGGSTTARKAASSPANTTASPRINNPHSVS